MTLDTDLETDYELDTPITVYDNNLITYDPDDIVSITNELNFDED